MKKLRFLLLSLITGLNIVGLQAQTFESDGINYTKFYSNRFYGYAVYVTKPAEGMKYAGDIKIPGIVSYDNVEYRVAGVGNDAFKDCTEMTSCVFEGIIEWIGNNAFEGCTGLKEFTIPSYYTDDIYQGYVYLGYRAFWGCHLESLTCMNGIPPIYNYSNPSWSSGISYPVYSDWLGWERGDHWHYFNTTTLYVPVGTLGAYSEKSDDYGRQKWGDYFTVIKEWGVEADDPVPGLYERINELKPICDETIQTIAKYSLDAYQYLLAYLYTIASEEGRDITALLSQLDASFETIKLYGWIEGQREGWRDYRVILKHKGYIEFFQNTLSEAQEKLEKMQEKRIAYYKARRSGDSSADSKKDELATLAAEVQELLNRIEESIVALDMDMLAGDCNEFVNDFKNMVTAVEVIKSDPCNLTPQWYNIQGQRLMNSPTQRGIYIRNGKKILTK